MGKKKKSKKIEKSLTFEELVSLGYKGQKTVQKPLANITTKQATELHEVYSDLRVLREAFSVIPPNVASRTATGGIKIHEDHWASKLLQNPNGFQTFFDWQGLEVDHLNIKGNFFCYLNKTGTRTNSMVPIHPDAMKAVLDKDGEIHYEHSTLGFVPKEYIFHRYLMPDETMVNGVSPIEHCAQLFGMSQATMDHGSRYFTNSPKAMGVIEFPSSMTAEAREEFSNSFDERYSQEGSFTTAVLTENAKFKPINLSTEHLQLLETRAANSDGMHGVFRVPATLTSTGTRSPNWSSSKEFNKTFAFYVLLPYIKGNEVVLTQALGLEREGLFVYYDMKEFLRGDPEARAAYYRTRFGMASMTPNQIRIAENEEPYPGGDQYYMEANFIPINENNDDQEGETQLRAVSNE